VIDVNVVVVDDPKKNTEGEVDPSMSLTAIKEDIAKSLDLGDPAEWIIAVDPQNKKAVLKNYQPDNGDTLYLFRANTARGPAFVQKSKS